MLMHRCVGTAPRVSARKDSAWIGRRACIYVDGPCWQGHGRFNRLLEAHVGVLTCVCPWERACTHGCVRVRLWACRWTVPARAFLWPSMQAHVL
jgi:hypothetical protein